jgi:hypothetical protein
MEFSAKLTDKLAPIEFAATFSLEIAYAILGAVYFFIVYRVLSPARPCFWGGILGYAAAFPLALLLLMATHHRGGPNTIHAVKSGFVFPIIAFSLGLPLMKRNGQH